MLHRLSPPGGPVLGLHLGRKRLARQVCEILHGSVCQSTPGSRLAPRSPAAPPSGSTSFTNKLHFSFRRWGRDCPVPLRRTPSSPRIYCMEAQFKHHKHHHFNGYNPGAFSVFIGLSDHHPGTSNSGTSPSPQKENLCTFIVIPQVIFPQTLATADPRLSP